MKVAVTGGTGFLGQHVVEKLRKNGDDVVILSRKSLPGTIQTDYSIESLTPIFNDVDAIVHLAAKRGSQGKKREFQDNEVLTQTLYDAALENNIKNVVYASTISVYSGEETLPWSEKTLPRPPLMYGVSKLTCEMIGNLYNDKNGMRIKNLRLAHLYGPNEQNNYMINLFFRQAFKNEILTLNTQSTAKREFLYVKDAAEAIIKALKRPSQKGTYNIGSDVILTNEEVADKINQVFINHDHLEVVHPDRPDTSVSSYMDNQLAEAVLDFKPQYTFEQALLEIFKDLKEQDDVPIYY